jgi:hypothetical protein
MGRALRVACSSGVAAQVKWQKRMKVISDFMARQEGLGGLRLLDYQDPIRIVNNGPICPYLKNDLQIKRFFLQGRRPSIKALNLNDGYF